MQYIALLNMVFPCFFITVKTSLGLGRVTATIIPQNENEDMPSEGLQVLQQWNPGWKPKFFMTDKSSVELNAVGLYVSGYSVSFIELKHGNAG